MHLSLLCLTYLKAIHLQVCFAQALKLDFLICLQEHSSSNISLLTIMALSVILIVVVGVVYEIIAPSFVSHLSLDILVLAPNFTMDALKCC